MKLEREVASTYRDKLVLTEKFMERKNLAFENNKEEFSQENRDRFTALTLFTKEILQALKESPIIPTEIKAIGIDFRVAVIENKGSVESVLLTPIDNSTIDQTWLFTMAKKHVEKEYQMASLFNIPEKDVPLLIQVHVPENTTIKVNGLEYSFSGWADGFGRLLMYRGEGLDGLPGRSRGHDWHEAEHRILETFYPDLYFSLFYANAYIDESTAIMVELLLSDKVPGSLDSEAPGHPYANANGMTDSYSATLPVSIYKNALSFKELDGGGKFIHDIYNQRMALSMFMITLFAGIQSLHGNDIDPTFETILNKGFKYLSDNKDEFVNSKEFRISLFKEWVTVIKLLDKHLNNTGKVSECDFWYTIRQLICTDKVKAEKDLVNSEDMLKYNQTGYHSVWQAETAYKEVFAPLIPMYIQIATPQVDIGQLKLRGDVELMNQAWSKMNDGFSRIRPLYEMIFRVGQPYQAKEILINVPASVVDTTIKKLELDNYMHITTEEPEYTSVEVHPAILNLPLDQNSTDPLADFAIAIREQAEKLGIQLTQPDLFI